MRDITICMAYYRNKGVLAEQLKRLRALPDGLKAHLQLSICDDGSAILQSDENKLPKTANGAEWEDIGFPFHLSRIDVNVRWNQDAARNIAVHRAQTEWLLLTDIDHIPPEKTLRSLIEDESIPTITKSAGRKEQTYHTVGEPERINTKKVYCFRRMTLYGMEKKGDRLSPYHSHPNSWFMTRGVYEKIGGYDERFAGMYGTDAEFRDRIRAVVGDAARLDLPLYRVPREVITDASTTTYTRKDSNLDDRLRDVIKKRDKTPGWQPKRMTFPWTIIR